MDTPFLGKNGCQWPSTHEYAFSREKWMPIALSFICSERHADQCSEIPVPSLQAAWTPEVWQLISLARLRGEAVYVVGHSAKRHSLWRELAGSSQVTDAFPLICPGMHTCATAGNDTCMGVFFAALGLEATQMSYPWDAAWNHGGSTRWKTQLLQGMKSELE